jgi:hypothetical protein
MLKLTPQDGRGVETTRISQANATLSHCESLTASIEVWEMRRKSGAESELWDEYCGGAEVAADS